VGDSSVETLNSVVTHAPNHCGNLKSAASVNEGTGD
jgi:hypothetical protein